MTLRLASVITSGGNRSATTPRPLTTPTSAAMSSVSTIPAASPIWVIRWPPMTPVMVTTAATDRSIPPISTTRVCPAATMPRNAATRSVNRLKSSER